MRTENKISLWSAIFININIMIGAGLFINTSNLARMVGAAGCVSYALLALLIYPLIASIATLVRLYPQGGFYAFAREINPFIGFVTAWSYFVSKLGSAVILTHSSMLLMQQISPTVRHLNIYYLDLAVLTLFIGCNLLNLKTGTRIQAFFLSMKSIPIFFVILSGVYFFSPGNYAPHAFLWPELFDTLPLVLFAAIGFEATTSLSSNIQDAQKNGPRAILTSYLIVMILNIAYQFFFYGSLGESLRATTSFLEAFPLLLNRVVDVQYIGIGQALLNIAIAASALGGAYGILFSNSWNLHTLATHKSIAFSDIFLRKNRHLIPYWCIATEGIICLTYLATTAGNQIALQQIAAFGCTIAYTLSILSLLITALRNKTVSVLMPALGLGNCLIFLGACVHSFITKGYYCLIPFGCFMVIGIIMHQYARNRSLTVS